MSRVLWFEEFGNACAFLEPDNQPMLCKHPENDVRDPDGAELPQCLACYCPLGNELSPETYAEDRAVMRRAGIDPTTCSDGMWFEAHD